MSENCMMPSDRAADDAAAIVAPRTPFEVAVAEIWAELLAVDAVSIHDNFLLLGGESLLATQAATRIRSRFNCELSVRSIFVSTVEEVAAEIAAAAG